MQAQPRQRTHQQALPAVKAAIIRWKVLEHVPSEASPGSGKGPNLAALLTYSTPLHPSDGPPMACNAISLHVRAKLSGFVRQEPLLIHWWPYSLKRNTVTGGSRTHGPRSRKEVCCSHATHSVRWQSCRSRCQPVALRKGHAPSPTPQARRCHDLGSLQPGQFPAQSNAVLEVWGFLAGGLTPQPLMRLLSCLHMACACYESSAAGTTC